jgi:hypothetical protein
MFNDRSNKYRHENKYCPNNGKISTSPAAPRKTERSAPRRLTKIKRRIDVKIKIKTPPPSPEPAAATQEILQELNSLRRRVQKMENEPRYNNWIIVGSDMFSDMIDKYGRTEALDFLTKSAITGDSVDIIKKLYLDGVAPEQYPIACKNYHHFRYLNDKREIIDDKGGQSVRKIFSDSTHKAMVLATNEKMKLIDPDSDQLGDTDVGDMFRKLGEVQCNLTSVHSLDINRLAGMTNNPDHPFFVDSGEK